MPEILPGQFVEIKVDHSATSLLRRPISVCDVDNEGRLILFIKPVGEGTRVMTSLPHGSVINILLPLGHGFSLDVNDNDKILLVGGGVGAAPLVMLSKSLAKKGADITVALGGRTAIDLESLPELYKGSRVALSTDDGSIGSKGVVTLNPVFAEQYSRIYCCGPTPMMKAVAHIAAERGIWCEVSLENHMACGLGACLCCVEETSDKGNVCVCTEGPVFNINRLQSWL